MSLENCISGTTQKILITLRLFLLTLVLARTAVSGNKPKEQQRITYARENY